MANADLVFLNGKICTVDKAFSFSQAVAVKNGWIIDVGSDQEIGAHVGRETRIIDLEGRLMLPGTHDSHLHAAYQGLWLDDNFIDVNDAYVQDLTEMKHRIREAAARVPAGTWLVGSGFKSERLEECAAEGRSVTRWDIDAATSEHPVMLTDGGLHRLLLNSRALELSGFNINSPELSHEAGKVIRTATGEPTGLFEDFGAQALIGLHAYHLSEAELETAIIKMQRLLNEHGITSHTDMAGVGGDHLFAGTAGSGVIDAYARLQRAGRLTARVSVHVQTGLLGIQSYEAIMAGLAAMKLPSFTDKQWLQADCMKIFGDDAWQREGWSGEQGYSYFPGVDEAEQAENMRQTIIEVHRRGWQMGIHLTGGRACDLAVESFIEAQQRYPGPARRHFLIHGSRLSHADALRCAKHKIGLSAQAVGGYRFAQPGSRPLTESELAEMVQPQLFADFGLRIAQGSDGPALPINWLWGLQFLVARVNSDGQLCQPELRCRLEDAIRMYTINGAYQEHREKIEGSIEVNKLADLQVLDRDLFSIPAEEIGDVKVVMTVVNGDIVYEG